MINIKSKFELVWFRVRAEKQALSVLRGSRFRNLLYCVQAGDDSHLPVVPAGNL
jgi:hypothetical protein